MALKTELFTLQLLRGKIKVHSLRIWIHCNSNYCTMGLELSDFFLRKGGLACLTNGKNI
jgi:hypothetical protein